MTSIFSIACTEQKQPASYLNETDCMSLDITKTNLLELDES
jgi:hypothetical protein